MAYFFLLTPAKPLQSEQDARQGAEELYAAGDTGPAARYFERGWDEAREGRDAFLEKREQDYTDFPWHF